MTADILDRGVEECQRNFQFGSKYSFCSTGQVCRLVQLFGNVLLIQSMKAAALKLSKSLIIDSGFVRDGTRIKTLGNWINMSSGS